jgi:YegS/Rv2252/BmrU family lipid kinase
MKVLVIANPAAGAGRGRERTRQLVRALEARGHAVERFSTRRAGDARRRVAEAEGAVECIVAAGGDGTLNEVVNGLADPSRTPLVPLALGTANMLAGALGIPGEPAALAEMIERGAVRRIDLGRVGGSRFLGVVGVGFDALVTEAVRRTRRGTLGYPGYALPILRTLASYRAPRLRVRLDGEKPVVCGFAIVAKLRNYGGLFAVTPDAEPDSGKLHICLFHDASIPGLVRIVLPAWRGTLGARDDCTVAAASRIEIESEGEPVSVQLDGDAWGATPTEIRLEPRVVPMLVPRVAPQRARQRVDAFDSRRRFVQGADQS